jgi:hypothetical protein
VGCSSLYDDIPSLLLQKADWLILWYFKGSRLWLCCCVCLRFFCCGKVHVLFRTFNFYYTFARGKTPLLVYWHPSTNLIFARFPSNWLIGNELDKGWCRFILILPIIVTMEYGVSNFIFLCISAEDIVLHLYIFKITYCLPNIYAFSWKTTLVHRFYLYF